jgi:pSer/pThr/pTyr-binding forkhead associated (FHA) protein
VPTPSPAVPVAAEAQATYASPVVAPVLVFGDGARAPRHEGAGLAPGTVAQPKILRGFLVAYGTNPAGDFWPLAGGRMTIGRLGASDGIDVPLQDPTVSSHHAALAIDAASGAVVLEDTGSTNGTFVNNESVGPCGRRDLRDGDRLRFGGFTAIVKIIGRV